MSSVDDIRTGAVSHLPNVFSKQLETVVGGHAVFYPGHSETGGGALGDCGYFTRGRFCKLFNVYESPPRGLPALSRDYAPFRGEVPNVDAFRSSTSSSVTFGGYASIPASVSPVSVDVSANVSKTDERFAFLACAGLYRVDETLANPDIKEIERYLARNHSALKEIAGGEHCIVRSTIKASGWVSAVAERTARAGSTGVSVGVPGVARLGIGGSWSVTSGGADSAPLDFHPSVGPRVEWNADSPPVYSVVLTVLSYRKRDMILSPFQTSKVNARTSHDVGVQTSPDEAVNTASCTSSTATTSPSPQVDAPQTDLALALQDIETGHNSSPSLPGSSSSLSDDEQSMSTISQSDFCQGTQPSLLNDILDEFLVINTEFDGVVGDSLLLKAYYENYGHGPRVGSLSYDWDMEYDFGESIAYVTKLYPCEVEAERFPEVSVGYESRFEDLSRPQSPEGDSVFPHSESEPTCTPNTTAPTSRPGSPKGTKGNSVSPEDRRSSRTAGSIQQLNNFYQSSGRNPAYIVYSTSGPSSGDVFACTLTLSDCSLSFTGAGVGKQVAKEAAARQALLGLGLL